MGLVEVPVPNLVRGVSQQPASNRQPGQVQAADNVIQHIVNGLGRRGGSKHRARLIAGTESVAFAHTINRDPTERYKVLVGNDRVRVFDVLDGREYKVLYSALAGAVAGEEVKDQSVLAPDEYLNIRTPNFFTVFQAEQFTGWTAHANWVGPQAVARGPFGFGIGKALGEVVTEAGNGAAASVSNINIAVGVFTSQQVFSVYLKKSALFTINDVELQLTDVTNTVSHTARFDLSGTVWSVGAVSTGVVARATHVGDDWYLCEAVAVVGTVPTTNVGATRRVRLTYHTNAASPENKRAYQFGARIDDLVTVAQPYIETRPDLFRAVTVADYTFLVNTSVVTELDTLLSPTQIGRAFIFVKSGGNIQTNHVINAQVQGQPLRTSTVLTGATADAAQSDLDVAASHTTNLTAHAEILATRLGSVVMLETEGAGVGFPFVRLDATDSRGDTLQAVFINSIDKFTNLPLICRNGHVVKVTGDPEREADDYYVKFVADEGGTTFGKGRWEETIGPGLRTDFKKTTMPHQLVRMQDDAVGSATGIPNDIYFEYGPVDWDDRFVGDDESNPGPSFIGQAIADVFFHRGRLGFLSGEHVVLSEATVPFNLWRTTVLDVVDTDPIDVDAGSRNVVDLRNAATTSENAMLFSDREQFLLLGEPTLTPASAQVLPTRAFENLAQAHPVDTGRGIVFATRAGEFAGSMEAVLLGDQVTFRFEDLTAQAPRYLQGRTVAIAASSLTNLTAHLTDEAENVLYLHQTFWDDQENRLQSAWARWTFDSDANVKEMAFLDTALVLLVERAEGWFLETLEADTEILESDGKPLVHLDRRVDQSQCTAVYAAGPNTTTITLPYTISGGATMRVVDRATGLIVPITASTATTVTVSGDLSASQFYVGGTFMSAVDLSEPVVQEQGPRGITPRMGRPLDVRTLHLYLAETAFLEVLVTPDLRTASTEQFSAAGLGTGLLGQGTLNLYTGDASFAIIGLSTEVTVRLQSDNPFPWFVQSARWECNYRARAASL